MTPTRRAAPLSRRERPAKPALTRAGIVAAAMQVLQSEGYERLTMRRLAEELDTGAASLYVYVRNTAELNAAVLDELLGAVDLTPVTRDGDWRERLRQVLFSYTHVLFEHPGLAQSAVLTRPSGPHFLDLVDGVLALLTEGKIRPDRAAWALDLLLQFATTTAAEQGGRDRALDTQDEDDALEMALQNVSATDHPHIAAIGADLLSGPGEDRLAWGLDVLINGALHTPRPKAPRPDH